MWTVKFSEEKASILDRSVINNFFYKDTRSVLSRTNAWLAGGALTSILSNNPVNDLDIFFAGSNSFDTANAHFLEKGSGYKKTYESTNAITYKSPNGVSIQLIKHQILLGEIKDILSRFDFNVCMCAYHFRSGNLIHEVDYFKDLSRKRLAFNKDALYPLASMWRLQKYITKGYSISSSDVLKISTAAAIELSQIKTNKDLAELLSSFRSSSYKDIIDNLLIDPYNAVGDLNSLYERINTYSVPDNPGLSMY